MKGFFKDNNYLRISLYAILVVVVSILFYRISSNTDNIAPSILVFFKGIVAVIAPILYGLLIAYLFNPIMIFFERYYTKWFKVSTTRQRRAVRSLSIVSVYLVIFGTLVLMIRYLVPQITVNLRDLLNALPEYAMNLEGQIAALESSVNESISGLPYKLDTSQIFTMIDPEKYLNADFISSILSNIVGGAVGFTSSLFNWIMGLVIAFYVLGQKESFSFGAKRLTYAIFRKDTAEKTIAIFSEGHETFIQFFVGKFIDSLIIGIIAFIGLTILGNPYAMLLALIIGVFNMIPYFGPLLGGIPAVIITLFTGFMPAVIVGIFVFLLQQFDGLVLGPKILGDSIGLSPFWIISGILIGGALWGPLGMFFAAPLIAVILTNINRVVDKRLGQREIVVTPAFADDASPATPKKSFINNATKHMSGKKHSHPTKTKDK